MCNQLLHVAEDTLMLETRPSIEMIRDHHYDDECCRVERCEDGPPRLKMVREWKQSRTGQIMLSGGFRPILSWRQEYGDQLDGYIASYLNA